MGFLAEIVSAVRSDVGSPDYTVGLAPPRGPARAPSLRAAIAARAPGGALLVEFKRASPGAPDPRLPVRSPRELVAATRTAPVAAYSCLATRSRFDGSPQDVAELVAATDRPVLFKDFVVDARQLDAAKLTGASAVLLIARLETAGLLDRPIAELTQEAHARGLEVLLEFHQRSELSLAAHVGADVYGVNVRDLDTLQLEPEVASETLRAARGLRPLAGLSGVRGPREAARFWELGVDAILVGTAVARAPDPTQFLASLERRGVP